MILSAGLRGTEKLTCHGTRKCRPTLLSSYLGQVSPLGFPGCVLVLQHLLCADGVVMGWVFIFMLECFLLDLWGVLERLSSNSLVSDLGAWGCWLIWGLRELLLLDGRAVLSGFLARFQAVFGCLLLHLPPFCESTLVWSCSSPPERSSATETKQTHAHMVTHGQIPCSTKLPAFCVSAQAAAEPKKEKDKLELPKQKELETWY